MFSKHSNRLRFSVFSFLLLFSLLITPPASLAQSGQNVNSQEFFDALSPYGQWINDTRLGFVWLPNVNDDFRPYFTNGRWVMTQDGNTWVSGYAWGWACFHYGRWTYNDYYGWVWVPGYEWGPGWVAWRWDDKLCGWAPLSPGTDWTGGDYTCPEDWWVFLHPKYLTRDHYRNIWRNDFMDGPSHTHKVIEKSHFVATTSGSGNTLYYSGPSAADIQQAGKEHLAVYHLIASASRGVDLIHGNAVSVYQLSPYLAAGHSETAQEPADYVPAPQRIVRPQDITKNWNKPRPFKEELQSKNPKWKYHFIRDNPPYFNYPVGHSMEDD
jgi:hypothetical protein